MAGLPLPVHTNNRSDLGARAGSLTLTPSEVRSLLLYVFDEYRTLILSRIATQTI